MVNYTLNTYHANRDRVYVTGTSSGAMMTEVLLALYPDIFKGRRRVLRGTRWMLGCQRPKRRVERTRAPAVK